MSLTHVTTQEEFDTKVVNSPTPTLVDFFAEWCGPCKMMGPILEEVAQENPNINIIKVDVDAAPELAASYNISSIPTFLVFQQGKVAGQAVGAVGKAQIKNMIAGLSK